MGFFTPSTTGQMKDAGNDNVICLPSKGIWLLILPSSDVHFKHFIMSLCGPLVSATLGVIDVSLLCVR